MSATMKRVRRRFGTTSLCRHQRVACFCPRSANTSSIQFVTTGPVNLRMGYLSGFVLQEDFDKILQENEGGILLEEPD